ncbi:MAG: glycosyltransferase family A protein [Paracoccaceae bacterium]
MIDISVIVTLHSETVMAGPTIRSADLAIAAAESAGLSVERLFGFDNPTPETVAFFDREEFRSWTNATHSFRDQGQLRNAMASQSTGRWIAFLDGDDIWSENWLVAAATHLLEAEADGRREIAHPEINWIFDRQANVVLKLPQDDLLFDPYAFYFTNYYDALAMAPRAAHLDIPYAIRDIPRGFAVEDWQWNIETMAAGWRHVAIRDTIIFKRRREMSQVIRAGQRSAIFRDIEPMRIDQVGTLGQPQKGPGIC